MTAPSLTLTGGAGTACAAPVLAVLTVPGRDAAVLDPATEAWLEAAYAVDVPAQLERAKARGKEAEVVEVPVWAAATPAVLLLVGTGDGSTQAYRRAGAALARRARGRDRAVVDLPADLDPGLVRALAEGALLAAYARPRRGTTPAKPGPLVALDLRTPVEPTAAQHAATEHAALTAEAAHLARDLANTPSDIKDPAWLAGVAQARADEVGLRVDVKDEPALRRDGFGGLLAVGSGSARPPRLIRLDYRPGQPARRGFTRAAAAPATPRVVLVGKGITFDSGGLSLKPREAMVPMKTDMTGGGVVIAVLAALPALGLPIRVTGLIAAAENMPGAAAVRPGDVITQYGGRTVEVFNTDAEGRLVLADALAYADAVLEPDIVVDLATLTGAASMGLGRRHAALYSDDDALAAELLAAGEASGERLWRMPLPADYRAALDSDIADLSHISRDPHLSGGSITAALFLREFTGGRRWAHLDIAGPARADSDEHEVTKGGTGFGARVLLRWLEGLAAA